MNSLGKPESTILKVTPTIQRVIYSEPKFMTYLAICIVIALIFTCGTILFELSLNRKLSDLQAEVKKCNDTVQKIEFARNLIHEVIKEELYNPPPLEIIPLPQGGVGGKDEMGVNENGS